MTSWGAEIICYRLVLHQVVTYPSSFVPVLFVYDRCGEWGYAMPHGHSISFLSGDDMMFCDGACYQIWSDSVMNRDPTITGV